MPKAGAPMQRIEFRSKSVAKKKRDGSGSAKESVKKLEHFFSFLRSFMSATAAADFG